MVHTLGHSSPPSRNLRSELSRRQLIAGLLPLLFLMLSYAAWSAADAHRRAQDLTRAIATDWRWSIQTSLEGYRNAIDSGTGLLAALGCAEDSCSDVVLISMLRANPNLRSAAFIDAGGVVQRAWLARNGLPTRHPEREGVHVEDREYFRRARDERNIITSQPYASRGAPETVIAVATAVRDPQGQFRGVLHVSIAARSIAAESSRLLHDHAEQASFLLLDAADHVIASNLDYPVGAAAPIFTSAAADTPSAGITHAVGGHYLYFAQLPLSGLDWRMAVFLPASQSIASTASFLVFLLLSGVVGIAIAWFSGRRLARTLAVPMESLARDIETLHPEQRGDAVPMGGLDSPIEEVRRIGVAAQSLAARLLAANDNVEITIAMQRELNARLEATVKERDAEIDAQTAQLRLALEEAEEALEVRNRLLANTSHELRTPLQGIIGSAELLSRDALTPEQHFHALTVMRCGEGMLQLVNDLLDVAYLRTGSLTLEVRPFDLGEEVATIVEGVVGLAEQRGLQLETEIAPDTHRHWAGDAGRLRQVLFNLLTNALKFTEAGTVALHVRQTAENVLRFEVHDTGVGIAQQDQERIFEAFVQVDAANSRWFQGTGLGLAISRQLVELMGGELEVDSVPGEGSMFYCNVPLRRLSSLQPGSIEAIASIGRANASLLLVDDSDINRDVIMAQLKALGISAIGARDGFAALQYLSSNHCDLMLLDCQMPGMDGYEVTRRIRERWPDRALPIVAITAHASATEHARCLAAGMDDYLPKPLRLAPLRATLERYLGLP